MRVWMLVMLVPFESSLLSQIELPRTVVLVDAVAAVDHDQLPGDVRVVVRSEEGHQPGDLFGPGGAAHRGRLSCREAPPARTAGVHPPWGDRVHQDALWGYLERQAPGEPEHSSLG